MSDTGRRSARIQEKRDKSNNSLIQDVSSESNIGVEVQPVRKAKKAKTATTATRNQTSTNANPEVFRRTRGKRGLLEKLAKEAPLDILLEIFKHLEPRDVLHLSRTSKDFRGFLMRRSSSSIWREARENLPELPPLPFDLNEPQYASLLFDNHCYACLRSPCDNVIWRCRVRCHQNCTSQLFFDYYHYAEHHTDIGPSGISIVTEAIPHHYCKSGGRYSRGTCFPVTMFERLLSQYKEIRGDESAVQAWRIQRRQDLELIKVHAGECHFWEMNRREKRQAEQNTLRNERREEIIKRLSASGWGPKELNHRQFLSLPLFKPSKPVTERVWNNLEPQLVECLQVLKEKRLENERHKSLTSRYELLKSVFDKKNEEDMLAVYPPLANLILDGTDLKVCDDMIWNTPHDQQLVEADFVEALQDFDIAGFAREWIKKKNQGLAELLRNRELETYSPLSVIFTCKSCGTSTWVPRIYMHRCYGSRSHRQTTDWNRPGFDPICELRWYQWREDAFFPNITLTEPVKEMMTLCGDAEPRSIEDLDQLDPLFECVAIPGMLHAETREGRHFVRWLEAIMVVTYHKKHQGSKLVLAHCDEGTKHQILEQEQSLPVLHRTVVCKHCPPGSTNTTIPWDLCIRTHLQTDHGIDPEDAKRNVDWCYRLDANVFRLRGKETIFIEDSAPA
ncbi:hypothetical protein L218DRAFT_895151 [Marasmius fiardii PR-910]|nr:hypothetical protein L218DRAFT_895151 [Marasmius fiardii PR-910]